MTSRPATAHVVLLIAAALCSGCGSDDPATRTYRDVGKFCLEAKAGEALTFTVRIDAMQHCLSACDEHVTSCSATLTGRRVELRTLLVSKDAPGVMACPAVCLGSSGACTLDAVPPGAYQFGFASRFDTATLPLSGPVPLFGDHGCNPTGQVIPSLPR